MALNKAWININDRSSLDYINGVNQFLEFAFMNAREEDRESSTIRCPCNNCRNIFFLKKREVRLDLLKWGMYDKYTFWEFHGEKLNDVNEKDNVNEFDDTDSTFIMLQDACGVGGMNLGVHEHVSNNSEVPEEPNTNAKKFFKLLEQYQVPLTKNGESMSKLSYLVKLLHLKVLNNWCDSSFDSLLKLEQQGYGGNLPTSYYEAKKLITDLGLDYCKIDACENDCILYWRENENLSECPICGMSRWKVEEEEEGSSKGSKVPRKLLKYFPLKPRLQRLYMSQKTAKDMRWHKERDDSDTLGDDGKDSFMEEGDNDEILEGDDRDSDDDTIMRHPADSFAWKSFDEEFCDFSAEVRNVRLGLACDGFQPFDNSQHSIWPVVLIPYNLPPWMCMKAHSFMLSTLIPGPTSPGRNIDVYLQPLIEELKDLWEVGVETYDAHSKQNFIMRASLLWTISDFPAYADLSGWSTKGHYACPCCHKDTSLMHKGGFLGHRRWLPTNHKWRKDASSFDGKVEKGGAPIPLTGDEVLQHFSRFSADNFGKLIGNKRKWDDSNSLYGWKKKSIFFNLPYWRKLKICHNLDVMHIEKNVSDNILGTLMSIQGKNKDTLKARMDLVKMKIRDKLHPKVVGDKVSVPVASYTLSTDAKVAICNMFAKLKAPNGYLSNISRCVKDNGKKISCMKSHDHHVFIEQLLPIALRGFLPKEVYDPLVELSFFFRDLCSRSISISQLDELEKKIPYTLCKLEMIFPPAFFDVMVHLVIHLAAEAKIAGPVCYRWMYPIERYLRTLKAYIRNRAHPEGCIAEGYLANECLTFCSRYMSDIDTKFNRKGRNDDEDVEEGSSQSNLEIFRSLGHSIGGSTPVHLSFEEYDKIHFYILQNYDPLLKFVKKHKLELEKECPRNVERRHKEQFAKWIQTLVKNMHELGRCDEDLYNLVCGPSRVVRRYTGYIVNGFRFHTKDRSQNRDTQNNGVMVRGDESCDKEYYGVLTDIFEVHYPGGNRVFVFKCSWFDIENHGRGYKVDEHSLISVNKSRVLKSDEVYVLESQVEQVFYIEDEQNENWMYVVKAQPRDLYNMKSNYIDDRSIDVDAYQQVEVEFNVREESSKCLPDDFTITSPLVTNLFVDHKEDEVVNMVKNLIEDHDFINDGEIEVIEDSSDEEEDFEFDLST